MRRLYSLALYLFLPLALIYLAIRSLRNSDYRRRWPERLGFFEPPPETGGIVVHAASLGEVNAANALVRSLLQRSPRRPVVLTTFTPSGSERARALFSGQLFHVYIPLDLPGAVHRFFDRLQPERVIVMETEIWPNLYHEARRRRLPLLLVNARISERSVRGYRRFHALGAQTLRQLSGIGAQTEADAERLVQLGADREIITVTGNLKFDLQLPPSLHEQGQAIRTAWGAHRPVLVAGSTHEGDEIALLQAFRGLLASSPGALLVLAPRHPERFGRAAQLARAAGLRVCLRSEGISCPATTQCFVVDAMGELLAFYAAGDVAFVGGSLAPVGGHNVLEPAALSKPVVVGPHTANFKDITAELVAQKAALRVQGKSDLEAALKRLFREPDLRDRMGRAGERIVQSGQGALQRTLDLLDGVLTPAGR
ncbi:MAG: lipid IV(A) 3-deoxy-D-manno-octulosonic acid transferase [Xanthomonadales bacterium]|nr:lipid IV(A) 3-deoxy-D-manno-octulosonic acid transferase [Xanthomonadales bacterium]